MEQQNDQTGALASVEPQTGQQSSNDELSVAIAALTAALKQNPPADPKAGNPTEQSQQSPAQVQEQEQLQGEYNSLDPSDIPDPAARSMAVAFKALAPGVDLDRVFSKAIEEGDPSRLDLAYLKDKCPQHFNELQAMATSLVQASVEMTTKLVDSIHEKAGGADNWNTAVSAFNEKAPAAVRAVIKSMLDSAKPDQVQAAADLIVEFAKDNGFVQTSSVITHQNGAINQSQALSAEEFKAAVRQLDGSSPSHNAEYQSLVARRRLGVQLGK